MSKKCDWSNGGSAGIAIKQGRGVRQVFETEQAVGTTCWEVTLELRVAGGEGGAPGRGSGWS